MKSDDSMGARLTALARRWADERNWFTLPGIAGVYDPAAVFEGGGYRVAVYGSPDKQPGWGWAIQTHPGSDEDIETNWSFTAAEAKQDAWRELVRLIRGERTSRHGARLSAVSRQKLSFCDLKYSSASGSTSMLSRINRALTIEVKSPA
jgi:hypothetical protein